MKKKMRLLAAGLLAVCLTACEFHEAPTQAQGDGSQTESLGQAVTEEAPMEGSDSSTGESSGSFMAENTTSQEKSEEETMFYITVGETTFSATFADNVGAQALQELLAGGDITIQMSDYGGFEKVGALGQDLPTENSQITTEAGDIMLYQGNQIVIFYGSNSWSYTPLGTIKDLTGWEEALEGSAVSVTLSLSE